MVSEVPDLGAGGPFAASQLPTTAGPDVNQRSRAGHEGAGAPALPACEGVSGFLAVSWSSLEEEEENSDEEEKDPHDCSWQQFFS